MSCPLNNPTTPIGLMGIQASTTSTFLSPYTGTKIAGRCGVIQLLNPNTTNVMWDIYNFQPLAFNDLLTNGYPLTLTFGNWGDGVQPLNVIQYIGVFSSTSSVPATAFAAFPNVYFENRIEFDPSPLSVRQEIDNVLERFKMVFWCRDHSHLLSHLHFIILHFKEQEQQHIVLMLI